MIKDFTVVTWNVRGITHKFEEPNRESQNMAIDISETKKNI
jgi:hypothetical protein